MRMMLRSQVNNGRLEISETDRPPASDRREDQGARLYILSRGMAAESATLYDQ